MASFEGREPNEKTEAVEKSFDEAVKAAGCKTLHEGFSEGAEDLLEDFAKLRAESWTNASTTVIY